MMLRVSIIGSAILFAAMGFGFAGLFAFAQRIVTG
jgi:hypothetical protein